MGHPPKIALALAGGGPLGAIYEIGAMCALEESLVGLDFSKLHHYVGVSAGGFITAALANGFTPRELCASFIENDSAPSETFDPSWLLVPAYGEFVRRGLKLPGLLFSAFWQLAVQRKPLVRVVEHLSSSLPTGVFSNHQIHTQLERLFNQNGRTNDFRKLKTRLTLVATNLDSAEAAPFGEPGWDHVPISQAVQASSALPGLYPPVVIDGRFIVDGALRRSRVIGDGQHCGGEAGALRRGSAGESGRQRDLGVRLSGGGARDRARGRHHRGVLLQHRRAAGHCVLDPTRLRGCRHAGQRHRRRAPADRRRRSRACRAP